MRKTIILFIIIFYSFNSQSQLVGKINNYKIDTRNRILEKGNDIVVLGKSIFIERFFELSESEIEKGYYNLNYKVDENGNITFIKGHLGFAKIEIPYEFKGIHFPYYEDDKFINNLNTLIKNSKITHYIFSEKQPDCKKLKNVVFYGYFHIGRVNNNHSFTKF